MYKDKAENRPSGSSKDMTKMDIEQNTFKPQEFRSSRSDRKTNPAAGASEKTAFKRSEQDQHEKAMFGVTQLNSMSNQLLASTMLSSALLNAEKAEKTLMNPSVSIFNSFLCCKGRDYSNDHFFVTEKLFEDAKVRETRWKAKVLEHLRKVGRVN